LEKDLKANFSDEMRRREEENSLRIQNYAKYEQTQEDKTRRDKHRIFLDIMLFLFSKYRQ
jgi:hypothetical protein